MPKMEAAKMDVVRFTESDVIVASGNLFKLSGCDDNTTNNMLLTKGNTTLFSNSKTNPVNILAENGYGDNPEFYYYNTWGTTSGHSKLNDIADFDKASDHTVSFFVIDGDYTWDGNAFRKTQ